MGPCPPFSKAPTRPGAANSSVKTPAETVPGRELGPTSAQVARRERFAASRTSSQRVRIISASAASAPPGALAGPAPCEGCSAEPWDGAAEDEEKPCATEAEDAAETADPRDEPPSFGPSQLTAGPACGACAAEVGPAAGAEAGAGADAVTGAPAEAPSGSFQPPACADRPQPSSDWGA